MTRKETHPALSFPPQTGVDLNRIEEMAGNIKGFVFRELLLFPNLSKRCRTVKTGNEVRILGKGMKERNYADVQMMETKIWWEDGRKEPELLNKSP